MTRVARAYLRTVDTVARTATVEPTGADGATLPAGLGDHLTREQLQPDADVVLTFTEEGGLYVLAALGHDPAKLAVPGARAHSSTLLTTGVTYSNGNTWVDLLSVPLVLGCTADVWLFSALGWSTSTLSAPAIVDFRVAVGATEGGRISLGNPLGNLAHAHAVAGRVAALPAGTHTAKLQCNVRAAGSTVSITAGQLFVEAR